MNEIPQRFTNSRSSDTGPGGTVDLLLLHGTVLTMDAHGLQIEDGAVAITDGYIEAVGPTTDLLRTYRAQQTLDCQDHAILPGLIDTYTHAGHGLVRGLFDAHSGWPATHLYWHATTPQWWRAEARLGALERTSCGVTTAVAIVGATPPRVDEPTYAVEVARGYEESGLRVVVGVGPPDPIFPHLPTPWRATRIEANDRHHPLVFDYASALDASIEAVHRIHDSGHGRISACLAPPYLLGRHVHHRRLHHALPTPDDAPSIARRAQELRQHAQTLGILLHTHMFRGSVAYAVRHLGQSFLDEVLGPDVVVAHANGLQPPEIAALGSRSCGVSVVPTTHENLWYGLAPVVDLFEAGARVSIATDGAAPYCSLNLWRELSRATWNQWHAHGDQSVLGPEQVLRMVTIDAARTLGMHRDVGSLEAGKKADVITVDLASPRFTPLTSLAYQLVHFGSHSDVHTVIVDGTVLKHGRDFSCLEPGQVLDAARDEAAAAFGRVEPESSCDGGGPSPQGGRSPLDEPS